MQLILLDMFPAGRGAAVSLFTFFTLLLNGLVASRWRRWSPARSWTLALASTGDGLGRAGVLAVAPRARAARRAHAGRAAPATEQS